MDENLLIKAIDRIYSKYSRAIYIKFFIKTFLVFFVIVSIVSVSDSMSSNNPNLVDMNFNKHIAIIDFERLCEFARNVLQVVALKYRCNLNI